MFRTIIIAALMSAFAGSAFAMECTQAEMDKLDIQLKAMITQPDVWTLGCGFNLHRRYSS